MDGSVPGFVPRLNDPIVGLFRAEERVFDAMLDGWRAQMLARGLTTATIENRCRLVRRFQEFTGEFPWPVASAGHRGLPGRAQRSVATFVRRRDQ
jgi:integrase/recombinase XerD